LTTSDHWKWHGKSTDLLSLQYRFRSHWWEGDAALTLGWHQVIFLLAFPTNLHTVCHSLPQSFLCWNMKQEQTFLGKFTFWTVHHFFDLIFRAFQSPSIYVKSMTKNIYRKTLNILDQWLLLNKISKTTEYLTSTTKHWDPRKQLKITNNIISKGLTDFNSWPQPDNNKSFYTDRSHNYSATAKERSNAAHISRNGKSCSKTKHKHITENHLLLCSEVWLNNDRRHTYCKPGVSNSVRYDRIIGINMPVGGLPFVFARDSI